MEKSLSYTKTHVRLFRYGFFYLLVTLYLLRLLSFTFYGIDFSDEGRHLNEIKHTYSYSSAASQFGVIIQPFANFINFNIPVLRILNLGTTFLLCFFALRMQMSNQGAKSLESKAFHLVCCSSFGVIGLSFFNVWLPTPSYYSLTFQSLLIFWISFKYIQIEKNSHLNWSKISLLSLT